MKKRFLLGLVMIFSATTLFGQSIERFDHKFETKTADHFFQKEDATLNKRSASGLYSYVDRLRENGETFVYFGDVVVWPDSLPLVTYDNGTTDPTNAFAHSVGQVFDPNSFYYTDPESFDSRFVNYTVDSVLFLFKYHNFGDSTDELHVQFYDPSGIIGIRWNAGGVSRSVSYNRTTGLGDDALVDSVITLDSSNNTPLFFINESRTYNAIIQLPVDIQVTPEEPYSDPENLFAMTMSFKPGNPNYSLNDTFNRFDSTDMAGDQMSVFAPYFVRGDGAASAADPSYNHGMMLFTWGVYGRNDQSFYYPYTAPGQPIAHTYTLFHVTTERVGVENMEAQGYGLGKAFPNPASASDLNIPIKLGNKENVSINVMDLRGKVVRSFTQENMTAGNHVIKFDVSDLSGGMYIYELNAGDYTSSNKVVVQ